MFKNRQPLLPTVTGEPATDLLLLMDTHHRSTRPTSTLYQAEDGGGGRDRTDDLMLAKHALSQLSYAPS